MLKIQLYQLNMVILQKKSTFSRYYLLVLITSTKVQKVASKFDDTKKIQEH